MYLPVCDCILYFRSLPKIIYSFSQFTMILNNENISNGLSDSLVCFSDSWKVTSCYNPLNVDITHSSIHNYSCFTLCALDSSFCSIQSATPSTLPEWGHIGLNAYEFLSLHPLNYGNDFLTDHLDFTTFHLPFTCQTECLKMLFLNPSSTFS